MAEFCLNCVNKIFDKNLTEDDVILAEDFCEECMQVKPCVMRVRTNKKMLFKMPFFFKKNK